MADAAIQKVALKVADGSSMDAFVARPADGGKAPGMMVFQEAFGVNAHIRDVTQRVAQQGYAAIAPELFHRTGAGFEGSYDNFSAAMPHMQAMTETGAVDDIRAAFDWLRSDAQVQADRIGSIGFCMGGRMSFLACATVGLRGAISFYGGGIAATLLPKAKDLHGPMLFFWGGLDKHIGQEQIRPVGDELRRVGKPFINVEISDADHGFFCDARGSYNPAAAREAWSLSLAFLEMNVKGVGGKTHAAS